MSMSEAPRARIRLAPRVRGESRVSGQPETAGPGYDFSPGSDIKYQLLEIGEERNRIILVEGLLRDPDSVIRFVREDGRFTAGTDSGSHFPGVRSSAPRAYVDTFLNVLEPLIRSTWGIPDSTSFTAASMFSLTTTMPSDLMPLQRVPHHDGAGLKIISAVHFLFRGPHGGTGFYRHRATGYETITEEREALFDRMVAAEIAKDGLPDGYVTQSNAHFVKTFDVGGAFNRLVLFPGHMLHSGSINPAAGLPKDVGTGRLTANSFLTLN